MTYVWGIDDGDGGYRLHSEHIPVPSSSETMPVDVFLEQIVLLPDF